MCEILLMRRLTLRAAPRRRVWHDRRDDEESQLTAASLTVVLVEFCLA